LVKRDEAKVTAVCKLGREIKHGQRRIELPEKRKKTRTGLKKKGANIKTNG